MKQTKVSMSAETLQFLRTIHLDIKKKLKAGLREITAGPSGGKVLKAELEGLRSFGVGRYRIVYKEASSNLEIIAIGEREEIYQDSLKKMMKDRHEI